MKTWVNTEVITNYYTITEIDAMLKEFSKTAEINTEIAALNTALTKAKDDLTAAYMQAITDAITKHNGDLSPRLEALEKADGDLQTAISGIKTQIDALSARVTANEAGISANTSNIASILARLDALEKENANLKNCISGKHTWDTSKSKYTLNDLFSVCTADVECLHCGSKISTNTGTFTCSLATAEDSTTYMALVPKFDANLNIPDCYFNITDATDFTDDQLKAAVKYMLGTADSGTVTVKLILKSAEKVNLVKTYIDNNVGEKQVSLDLDFAASGSIPENTFKNCAWLYALHLGDNVTEIGNNAFSGCKSLATVTFGENSKLTAVGNSSFANNTALTSVKIPKNVTALGNSVFLNCKSLADVELESGLKTVGSDMFCYCTALTSIAIPDSITKIEGYAFSDCANLAAVTFGANSGLTEIGNMAFSECRSLKSITLPGGLETVGNEAFSESGLTSISLPNSVKTLGTSVFDSCSALASIELGSGIQSIPNRAFANCTALASITIPDQVNTITAEAFLECTALVKIAIPDKVTKIGEKAFFGCTSLAAVTFGKDSSGCSIFASAFQDCTALTSIVLPDDVRLLGNDIFDGCTALTTIIFKSAINDIVGDAFGKNTENITLYFAKGQKVLRYTQHWTATDDDPVFTSGNEFCGKIFKKIIVTIDATAMSAADLQTKLEGLVSNGETTFSVCLAADAESDMFTAVKNGVSGAADGSVDIMILGAKKIADFAFNNCNKFGNVILSDDVTAIGIQAFSNCNGLKSITLGNRLETIGQGAFFHSSSLASVSIPDSVTSIGANAFDECKALASVTFGKNSSLTGIGNYVFDECESLKSIIIPSKVTSIGDMAFQYCISLESITIPSSVTSIGSQSFSTCASLTSITFQGTEAQWHNITKGTNWDMSTGSYTVTCTGN